MVVFLVPRVICWFLVLILSLFQCSLCLTHLTPGNRDGNPNAKDSSRNIEQIIKDEVDLDKDGLVSKKEIIHRMEKSFSQQRQNEVDGLMNKHDINYDNKISWKEFLSTAYPDEALRNSEDLDYDKKKFNLADMDQDGLLDSKEFGNFYFPGARNEDMIEMIIDDWLKKVDLNRDNFVTMDEFLASQSEGSPDTNGQRKLREHFNEDYDINKDGKLDKDELKWLIPTRASAMRGTTKILKLADKDGDGQLSMKEIIENDRSLHPLLHDTSAYKDEL